MHICTVLLTICTKFKHYSCFVYKLKFWLLVFWSVSLANFFNDRRHTNAGWILIGLIPVLHPKQGKYVNQNKFKKRQLRLWHACMRKMLQPVIEGFHNPKAVLCNDDKVRMVKPVVAAWLGDRPEHEKVCGLVGGNCQVSF